MDDNANAITQLLHAIQQGNRRAEEELIPVVYKALKKIAVGQLRKERPDHSLQPTALVHEAYLRLKIDKIDWEGRSHFFRVSANVMRRVLVDHARARLAEKRGDGAVQVTFDSGLMRGAELSIDVLALDEALTRLEAFDPRQAAILELHFFTGLTFDEIALQLEISERTAKRDWTMARAWLHQQLATMR